MGDGGWTVGTLREHFDQALLANDQKTDAAVASIKATVSALEVHMDAMFRSSRDATRVEFASQKEAVSAALAAAKEAVLKAETAVQERFASVNEFRQTLTDQAKTFMPRLESEAKHKATAEVLGTVAIRLDKIEIRLETATAERVGTKTSRDDTRTTIAAIIALVGLAVAIAAFVFKRGG